MGMAKSCCKRTNGMGNIVVTIFGKYNLPHTNNIYENTLNPRELWPYSLIFYLLFKFFYHATFWTLTYWILCQVWYLFNESHSRSVAKNANRQRLGNSAQNFELACPVSPLFFLSPDILLLLLLSLHWCSWSIFILSFLKQGIFDE